MPKKSVVIIRVPATTANIGPGFDGLGMALNLFNDFTVRPANRNKISGTGTCEGISGADNVFFDAFRLVCKRAKEKAPPVEVTVDGGIPVARGLGSSATAIVAAVHAANTLLGRPFDLRELLNFATEEEGHPDNVAPALLGFLTASFISPAGVVARKFKPNSRWRVALLIPDYPLETEKARRAIPRTVPLDDAVFNLTRIPFVIDALEDADAAELRLAVQDRLHEPYRKKLIRGYDDIRRAAERAGAAAVYLSGAGPTMAALCLGEDAANRAGAAMADAVAGKRFTSAWVVLKPWPRGAEVAFK